MQFRDKNLHLIINANGAFNNNFCYLLNNFEQYNKTHNALKACQF